MAKNFMENRRSVGRSQIARRLKFSQDFLMSNTLSPNAPIWTKWH